MPSCYKTSEFWVTVIMQALAVLVTLGIVKPSDQHGLQDAAVNAVTAIGTILASAHVLAHYIQSRIQARHAEVAMTQVKAEAAKRGGADRIGFEHFE